MQSVAPPVNPSVAPAALPSVAQKATHETPGAAAPSAAIDAVNAVDAIDAGRPGTAPSAASAPTPPARAQPGAVDVVALTLAPLDQGVSALHAALQQRYAFDPGMLQAHRLEAEALVKPWGLLGRVQEVVRATPAAELSQLAAALADPQVQRARAEVEMAANVLSVALPEQPGPADEALDPDLQLLHRLNPGLAEQGNPAMLAQARQFVQQALPAGGVARALRWLNSPAYATLVRLERATAAALAALPEAAAAAAVLARQLAPAQLHQCDEELKEEPRNSAARRVRADLASKIEGKHVEAIADLTEVLERDGLEPDYARRGDCHVALGQWPEAEQDYGRAALFATSSDRSLKAFLKMALRCLDAQHPDAAAMPLAVQARRAMLVLGVEGPAAAAPALAALKEAAPQSPEVEDLVALAATYHAPERALPPPAAITPTAAESEVGELTGQPLVMLPVFTRIASHLDVMDPLVTRCLAALEEDYGLFPEVVEPVRGLLLNRGEEFSASVAEALQKLCSADDGHAIEGMLTGPAGALVIGEALPLGERVHTALALWLRSIGSSVADVRIPRDLRDTPLRQLLQTLDPDAPAAAGGALGVQCDLLAGQLEQLLSPEDLTTLLSLMQTEPFAQLCTAYRHINTELFMTLQGALGEILPQLAQAQRAASDERLEADADDIPALTGRAMAFLAQGAIDEASADMDRLLALDPSAQNYRRRAALQLMRRQPDAAVADAQAGVRIAPRASQSYVMRSQAYLARGDAADALQDAMQAGLLAVSADEALRAQVAKTMVYQALQGGAPTPA